MGDGVDGGRWHGNRFAGRKQRIARPARENLSQGLHQRAPIFEPARVRGKARIGGKLWSLDRFAEALKLARVSTGDDQVPIGHRKNLIWHDGWMAIAHPFRADTGCQTA